jgi:NodT family efflux transporter outer membrane factor (OMF) lipoprotein
MWASSRGARQALWRYGLSLVSLMLSSCAVGPNYTRPTPPAIQHYAYGGDPAATENAEGVAQHFTPGAKLRTDWWRLFNSAKVDAIVAEALRNNPGIEAAQASLHQSQDTLRSGYGIFFPQAEADASAVRQRYSLAKMGETVPSSLFNLFTLSASVSYALDVFGGERRLIEELRSQVDLQRADEQATYLTLIANIVNTVVAKAAYKAEIDATQRLIELESEQVNLAEVQAQAGTVPYSNVLSLESQLASYQATIPQLQQKLSQSDDLLATLVGRAPAEWGPPDVTLKELTLPSELPVELPSVLVSRRPDILIAEASAHAASAGVGVATAALLPSFSLNGNYSANGLNTGSLLSSSGRAWSVGADASAPLFQGGTLWYKRKAALDNYKQATALYRQTVLGAFAQVADTVRALEHDAAALKAEDSALSSAQEALELVQDNYAAGLDTYLDVLNADAQYHQAKINDLQSIALRYQDTVALYVALGGGWWSEPQPSATAEAGSLGSQNGVQ